MPQLNPQTLTTLQQTVDSACTDQEKGIPGAVVVVVTNDGEEQFAHASGTRGYGTSEPMTLDSIFWIASCTKMITGVACMQLVEKGVLGLDDVELVERYCPELKEVKVLNDEGVLVEKERGITLRMLLNHTGLLFFGLWGEDIVC